MFKKHIPILIFILFLSLARPAYAAPHEVIRIDGQSRYETSVNVSRFCYSQSAYGVIANGENFPDALSGGSLAHALKAPLLLVKPHTVPSEVLEEIQRLQMEEVYLLGGESAISADVEKQLSQWVKVTRIAGENRYETSFKIVEKVRELGFGSTVLISNGRQFADALSAGGYLAQKDAALLLTDGQSFPQAGEAWLEDGTEFIILGGPLAVSDSMETLLNAPRLSGESRFDTSLAIAGSFSSADSDIILVNGRNFPDGLTAISLASTMNAPVLLSEKDSVDENLQEYLRDAGNVTIVGGPLAISRRVETWLSGNRSAPLPKYTPPVEERLPTNHIAAADSYAYDTLSIRQATRERSSFEKKIAFLTFDDGPNTKITPQVLDVLAKYSVPATFFIPGYTLSDSTSSVLKRIYNEGHGIALHSYSHDYNHLYPNRSGNASRIVEEAQRSQSRMKSYLGGGFHTKVWRYPGGHMSWNNLGAADTALAKLGIQWIDWNAMTGDAEPASRRPTTVSGALSTLKKTIANAKNKDVLVILMHDATTKQLTVNALPGVISYLRQQGYDFGILQ